MKRVIFSMVIIMAWLCISFKPPKIDLAKNNMKKQDDTYLTLSMLYDDLLYENPADKQMAIDEVLNAVPPEISYQWLQQLRAIIIFSVEL